MVALTLARPADRTEKTETLEILVKGARCANCVSKIETGMRRLAGVSGARLNLATGKLTVQSLKSLDKEHVIRMLRALGYEAWPFDAAEAIADREREGRALLTCLAVAGFGVAFVVGLTDALWYGATDMGPGTRNLFSWIAALVATPTALYGGSPFFRSALRSLNVGRANMDVPISLAILFSLGLSFYETLLGGARTYFDAAVMLPFLLLVGRYLDFMVRRRASRAASDLVAMQAVQARRISDDGKAQTIAARDVVAGDRILLAIGERNPVDGIVDANVTADLSLVSGETAPAFFRAGEVLQAGAIVLDRPITLLATHEVENSLVAKIARLVEAGQQARNRYVRLADRAAHFYVPLVHGLALGVFLTWLFVLHGGVAVSLRNGISLLIITCPCALGLAVPAVQVVATGLLFRRGMLVKSGDALERLAEVDVALFDKTGTLTAGKPTLLNANTMPPGVLARAARLARASRHPLARAIVAVGGEGPAANDAREVAGSGIELAEGSTTTRLGNAKFVGVESDAGPLSALWFREEAAPAVRFDFADAIRSDAKITMRALRNAGIEVEILSGDAAAAVASIAHEAGIENWAAQSDPIAKTQRLEALKAEGHKVMMVGDGLNDAASVSLAHVSISPGSAVDATQACADMVFEGASLWPIAQALSVARTARRRMLQNFAFAALYNAFAIPLAALGLVTPLIASIAMASSSLLVTLNALRQRVPERC